MQKLTDNAVRRMSILLILVASIAAVQAQTPLPSLPDDTTAAAYSKSMGLLFRLDASGLGLGGTMRRHVTDDISFTVEASVGLGKDEREQQFFTGFLGDTVTPLKRNYVLLLPIHAGLEWRVLRNQIESNFRPFVHLAAGPTIAIQWPYFDDANGNGIREEDEDRVGAFGGLGELKSRGGIGGIVGLGAYLGDSERSAQGIRIGFEVNHFFRDVELLEPREDVENPSRRTFATPVISFHLVRLL